jgi:hypothetical protein
VLKDEEIGVHPHDAYLEMMYLGGVIYTLPMVFLVLFTIVAAIRVFLDRKHLPIDPLLALIFVFVLAGVYVHAVFGVNGWYPTSAWAFMGLLFGLKSFVCMLVAGNRHIEGVMVIGLLLALRKRLMRMFVQGSGRE